MFEDPAMVLDCKSVCCPLTNEEELAVRRIASSTCFGADRLIEYLNSHLMVRRDVFEYAFVPVNGNRLVLNFLTIFKEIERTDFILRLPIYFYDYLHPEDNWFMGRLFDDFKYTVLNGQDIKIEPENGYFGQQNSYPQNFDLEPLYEKLQRVVCHFEIPLCKVFEYLLKQCGSPNYEIFEFWFQYIELVDDLNESNVFPRNILFSLNTELEKHGKEAIIFYPFVSADIPLIFLDDLQKFAVKRDGDKFFVSGFFPTDEEENVVLKWVAIWFSNAQILGKLREKCYDVPALRTTIVLQLESDSMIFIGHEEILFGLSDVKIGYRNYWEQVYVGAKNIQFDSNAIIEAREKKHLSIKEVAIATGINPRTYQRIEYEDSSPDGLNLIKLLDYFNLDYQDLIQKVEIEDKDFVKFRSGEPIQHYISDLNYEKVAD